MTNRVVAITGATSGIGRATAESLAQMGATVIACGRSPKKLAETADSIRLLTGNPSVKTCVADLSSMTQVHGLAESIAGHTDRLDVLINNAGVVVDRKIVTEDGFELSFAVNYLAPFLLTTRLLPLLKKSAPSRIVMVSSALHKRVKALNLNDVVNPKRFNWGDAYNNAKLAEILFTKELAKRLKGSGVTCNALHPGVIATEIGRKGDLNGINALLARFSKIFLPRPDVGAKTSVYLATAPDLESVSGHYFEKCKEAKSGKLANDQALAEQLWLTSQKLLEDHLPGDLLNSA